MKMRDYRAVTTVILLCSAAMDVVVTQVVDGTKGIHAMIAKEVFTD